MSMATELLPDVQRGDPEMGVAHDVECLRTGIVNVFLVVTNFLTSPVVPWSAGPLLGWGLGLAFHGLFVYRGAPGTLEEKEYDKLKNRHGPKSS